MVINDKMETYQDVAELRHYGRNHRLDKFFTNWLGDGRFYNAAWMVTARLRKLWPAFLRWTMGECDFIHTYPNGITNTGKAAAAGLMGDTGSVTAFGYLAYGSSNTAFAAGQTALVAQIQREAATVSRTTTSVTNDTLKLVKAFSITSTETAAEGGIFNASSGGTMAARVVFSPSRSMASGDTLTYTHYIQFS